ncbi:MAG TPA: hypothetical protein VHE78_10900 [Gemmatimonadaceae bacterium]|nr:hypothetical protein [Gemmatimonadaceae bacterium]
MERAEDDTPGAGPAVEQAYGTIVVVGGGCYGSYYVRQLRRASARGALKYNRLLVVDRDPACAASAAVEDDLDLRVADWSRFFSAFLAGEAHPGDAIVPSPLMPHLLFQWLEERARHHWPHRRVTVQLPGPVGGVPWQREGQDRTRYVSFAEWICPVNCIEPRICPHTRGERTWSMPPALLAHVKASPGMSEDLHASVILHCTHRAYGVGMIDVDDVLGGERTLVAAADGRRARVLVGTVSHCHGALGILAVE